MPVSLKSFRPFSGSDAVNVLATLPEGYPTTDFYGNPISAGAAAGAVQTVISGYYMELSVLNNSNRGSVTITPPIDDDGIAPSSFTLSPVPSSPAYSVAYWVVNGVTTTTAPTSLSTHSFIQVAFTAPAVNNFNDTAGSETTPGTLRYALSNAQDGDTITLSGVTSGTTKIELQSPLPQITKSITIEGNGITLTRAASWTGSDSTSQLLRITSGVVTIRRVHFTGGLATDYGGAIQNQGNLALESCIFSGNQVTSTSARGGGAVYSNSGYLTIRGCTFYGNTAGYYGGAVYFYAVDGRLTVTGNLLYGNTAGIGYPVVRYQTWLGSSFSYNVVDVTLGSGTTESGWGTGTGDTTFTALGISSTPFNTTTFAPASALQSVLSSAPTDFPETDFNGNTRTFPGAPGAVR